VIVAQRVGHLEQAGDGHGPVVLHPSRDVDTENLQAIAEVLGAHPACAAHAARDHGLDDNAITLPEAARGRRLRHFGKGLVTDDAAFGHTMIEVALEDVKVRAADADATHAQQCLALLGHRHRRGRGSERPVAVIVRRSHQLPPQQRYLSRVSDRAVMMRARLGGVKAFTAKTARPRGTPRSMMAAHRDLREGVAYPWTTIRTSLPSSIAMRRRGISTTSPSASASTSRLAR
jgi:hypothetical protein